MRESAVAAALAGSLIAAAACKHHQSTNAAPTSPSPQHAATSDPRDALSARHSSGPIVLDGGGLRVDPTPGGTIAAHAAVAGLKSAEISYYHHTGARSVDGPIAVHGIITLGRSVDGPKGVYAGTPGWAVFYRFNGQGAACPAEIGGLRVPSPLPATASTWRAFLLADTGGPALLYSGQATGICTQLKSPLVMPATQHIAVAWHVVSQSGRHLVVGYRLDPCATFDEGDSGGAPVQYFDVVESLPFGAVADEGCPPQQETRVPFLLSSPSAVLQHRAFGRLGSDEAHRL